MRRAIQGSTLAEIIISIFLVGILLTIFANLVTKYSEVIHHQDRRDRRITNITMALETVTSEIEEALAVEQPSDDGMTREKLVLRRYNPEQTGEKLPNRDEMKVEYHLDDGTLMRTVKAHDGGVVSYPVAHEVKEFSVRREHARLFTVTVTCEEVNREYILDGKATMKCGI